MTSGSPARRPSPLLVVTAAACLSVAAASTLAACDDSTSPAAGSPPGSTSTALSASAPLPAAAPGSATPTSRPSDAPPPEEPCLIVTSQIAPLLRKPTEDASAQDTLSTGEVVKLLREVRPMRWSGKALGQKAHRDGMLLEVKHVDDGAHRFGFRSDLATEEKLPATPWLCDAMSAQLAFKTARCAPELRRAKAADGALLAYWPCSSGLCPVGLFRAGKMTVLGVENLVAARFFQGKKRSMLLATVRWTRDEGKQSGGSLVPILLDGPTPARKDDIPIDRVDARDPAKVIDHIVQVEITSTEVLLKGEETVKSATTGATLSTKPIEEKHPLPPLD